MTRPIYTHEELRRLIEPHSIAIVGASARAGSFGARTLDNLKEFEGVVYPINPRYEEVGGYRCYPSLTRLPEAPDCVVLAIKRGDVADAVGECVRLSVGGVIVYASGFTETGRPDLVAMQDELTALVAGTGTRVLGPNCLGVTNYVGKARIMFGRMPVTPSLTERSIGVVTQSGSISMSLAQAIERGVSISHAIPCGNAADVGIPDLVNYLIDDAGCASIACTFEGIPNPLDLIAVAKRALAAGKPLVIYKMASSEAGAAAALSHTGALTGSHEGLMAMLAAAGAVIVDRLEDLVETAAFFAKAGVPTGRGVAVVLASGGLGVIAADKAEIHGVDLPQPRGKTLGTLLAAVPEFGAARNPCDVTAQTLSDSSPMETCAEAMLADPVYGALLVMHPYADAFGSARVKLWSELAAKYGKIICNYWSTEALQGHGAYEVEQEPGIATFRSLDRCFHALAAWFDLHDRKAETGQEISRAANAGARVLAASILAEASGTLSLEQGRRLLGAYEIPIIAERLAKTAEDAVIAAQAAGYPVALKIESPDIPHKTDIGGVALALRNDGEVSSAFATIMKNVRSSVSNARIEGVAVQPMVPKGVEIMLGATVDPGLGPQMVLGVGGVLVELLKDTAIVPLPTTAGQVALRLRSLRASKLLEGFRGTEPVDVDLLANIATRFSELVLDNQRSIREIEINPLICAGRSITAVDVLVSLKQR